MASFPPLDPRPLCPVAADALALIGGTPLVRLARLSPAEGGVVHAKLEAKNPGGSVKDRAALRMIQDALKDGRLRKGMTLIERLRSRQRQYRCERG